MEGFYITLIGQQAEQKKKKKKKKNMLNKGEAVKIVQTSFGI